MMKRSWKQIALTTAISLSLLNPAKSQENPQAQKLDALLNVVSYAYVDSVDQKKITEDAIRALLKELDPQYLAHSSIENTSCTGLGVREFPCRVQCKLDPNVLIS